jgi:transposase
VPGAESISLRQAYKAMAWLGEPLADEADRVVKDRVEEELFAARRDLFGQVSVAFYDTTSLYFEGRGGARLGRRGHSKDHRPQLNQVVLGVVLDDADRPICSFLWPGNTADVTTLMPVVERLRERFAITGACVVADRGMVSRATIAAFEERGIGYILGVRERGDREVRDHVLRDDGAEVPLSIPRQKAPATQLAVKEVKVAGRRYVVCRNEERAAQDAQARAAILEGLQKRLAQGDKALLANTGYRRYLKAPEGEGFSIDEAKVAADAQYDGVFVLRTNTRLSPLQVALRYRNLLAVEDLFRSAKSLIDTRPIFHQSDRAIRGHIFCSFLALVLRKELYDRLRAAGQTVPEWNRIVCDLQDLSEVVVVQDGRRAKLRTAPGPTIDPICRALGLSLPPTFQEMPPEDPSETCGA